MNTFTRTINVFLKNYAKKKQTKETFYQSLLKGCQNDMKRRWQIMKDITGKSKFNSDRFPKSINVNGKAMKKNSHITEEFNKYFINLGRNLASKIPKHLKHLKIFYSP